MWCNMFSQLRLELLMAPTCLHSTHVLVAQNAQQVTDRRLVSSVAQLDPQVQEPNDSVTANAD